MCVVRVSVSLCMLVCGGDCVLCVVRVCARVVGTFSGALQIPKVLWSGQDSIFNKLSYV